MDPMDPMDLMDINVSELRAHDYELALALCERAGQKPAAMQSPHAFVHCLRVMPGLSIAARQGDQIVGLAICQCEVNDGCRHELILPDDASPQLARLLADRAVSKIFSGGSHRGRLKLPSNPTTAELWKSAGWGPGPSTIANPTESICASGDTPDPPAAPAPSDLPAAQHPGEESPRRASA